MLRSWWLAGFALAVGLAVAAAQLRSGLLWVGGVEFVVFAALAWSWSPLMFPRAVPAEEALLDGRPVVYWRPGCRYCQRLRFRLGRDGRRAHWVNIWADPRGAAAVRAATGGDETVPTVALGGRTYVNPDPRWVRERLRQLDRTP